VTEGTFVTDGGCSIDVEVADIDGDGDLDVLVANNGDNGLGGNNAMYMNEGGGELRKLTEGAFVTDGGGSTDVEAADIDGDGDLDVLVANECENNAMYVNEGRGELRKVTEGAFVTDGGRSTDVEAADIDGDGDLDVLVANSGGENNTMYMNEGGGELRKVTEGAFVTDGGWSKDVEVADMDGDGDLDVLVANTEYGGENNAMYMNEGGGELRKLAEGAFVTDGGSSYGVEAADIDGDGHLDVLVANNGDNNAMYMNEGGGELRKVAEGAFVTDGGASNDVEVADIDGDGDLDILVANKGVNAARGHSSENNAMYIQDECAAGSARLATGASWCFDCPTFATQERLGDGAPRASQFACFLYDAFSDLGREA
jgi:hypothetical protein